MKTLLTTTFAILLFTVTCRAQWTGSGTGYTYLTNTSDKVGIGTASGTTPGLKLHILGALGFPGTTGTTQTGVLRLQGTGSNAVLDFGVNAASGAALQVTNQTDLSATYPLLLNPNGGSVGIGASPNFASGTGLEIQQAGPVTLRMENSTNSKSMELRQTATYFSLFNINGQHTIFGENGGNVGIGVTTPLNKLHIVDVTGTNTLNLQLSTNTLNETIGIAFGTQPGNRTKAAITGVNTNTGNAGGALAFYTNAGASLNEAMRVTATGIIGIGTATPASRLHVYESNTGNNSANGLTVEQGGTGNALLQFLQTGAQRWTIGIDNANAQSFKIATGTGLGISDKLSILTSGSVGIGTTNPYGTLDVKLATNQHIQFSSNTNGVFTNSSGIVCINDANTAYTPLGFYASSYYLGGGNMGIGTQSPDSKLTVNGKIHSTEVLVDLLVTGPDYVFKKNYNLPSLAYVEAYAAKNHHLPDVPAAAEMEKNGINVAEMNMTLLKKVEELTLYMIELNKTVKEQQKEIERLKNGDK